MRDADRHMELCGYGTLNKEKLNESLSCIEEL